MYPLHPDSSVRLRVAGVINKDQNTKNKRITQHLSASGMSGSLHTIKEWATQSSAQLYLAQRNRNDKHFTILNHKPKNVFYFL
jgi:hypothetical protein